MDLYQLNSGNSKKRMRPIMIDTKEKCENYKKAREKSLGKNSPWHEIIPAPKDAKIWRQKSSTIGGNRDDGGRSGYIGKNGFNPHT